MHRRFRPRDMAECLIVGLLVLGIGALGAHQVTAAPAAPSASGGRTGANAGMGSAPWLYMPSQFAGKVLHWSEKGSFFEPGIADPANGKVLLGDHWMLLGASGLPVAYFVRYTYPDGQLHQEIYQSPNTSIVVRGPDYLRPNEAVPSGWCVTGMQTHLSNLVAQYPLFANTAGLSEIATETGMRPLTVVPPTNTSLPGVTPTTQQGNVSTADVWTSTQVSPTDGSKVTRQYSLGPLGRVIAQSTTSTTKDGSTALSGWSVYGPLDVYASSVVPPTIFTVPQDLMKECA